jgi:hypothetical protein
MIKCYFVDVNNISSDLPRSSFVESELEQLANLILKTDGLLCPLILKESGVEKYTVVQGHREYYAALTAKEKDSRKAEMVNAFVISPQIQQSAIEQLSLLNQAKLSSSIPATDSTDAIVDKLLPTLLAAISELIQPMVVQLAEQKKMLDLLTLENSQLVIDKQPAPERQDIPPAPTSIPAKTAKVKPTTAAKTPAKSKNIVTLPASIASGDSGLEHPHKETNTLDLINTLSQDALTLKMERSSISKTVLKLVPNIIISRNSQPDRKFETWEAISAAKIKGLGPAKIKEIIDKLK